MSIVDLYEESIVIHTIEDVEHISFTNYALATKQWTPCVSANRKCQYIS